MWFLKLINNRGSTLILIFFIIVTGLASFANILGNSFVWDDEEMVVNNFSIFKIENIPRLFTQATFFSGGSALSGWFYRPFVMVAFLLTTVLFGKAPFGFHFVQLAIHITNAVLLFFIFSNIFNRLNTQLAKPIALFLSLFFVVHPAHVESVSYIASIAEPLYTFFLLTLFLFLLKKDRKNLSYKDGFIASILFVSALLTKEGSVIFLPIAVLYFWFFASREKLIFWAKYLFSGLLFYLLLRFSFFGLQMESPKFLSPITHAAFYEKILTAFYSFFIFLRTFFFPKELAVSQHFVVKDISDTRFLIGLISMILAAAILIYFYKKRYKPGLFFGFWFLASVFPVLNIFFPLDMTFAERWLYFSMIGILGVIGSIFLNFKKVILRHFNVFLILGGIVIVLLSLRTIIRNRDWRDGYALYSHDIQISKDSFDLENNLGVELFRRGDVEDAKRHFEKSITLQPEWTISLNNLGAVYNRMGDLKKAKFYYKEATEKGDYYLAYENLAFLLIKDRATDKVTEFLKKASLKFPQNVKINIANAIVYYRLGERGEALRFATRAVQLDPSPQNQFIYQTILSGKDLEFEKE